MGEGLTFPMNTDGGGRGGGGAQCHPSVTPSPSWMEACLGEELPPPTELEENLRNGVLLARLGHRFAPDAVPPARIYDPQQTRYRVRGVGPIGPTCRWQLEASLGCIIANGFWGLGGSSQLRGCRHLWD